MATTLAPVGASYASAHGVNNLKQELLILSDAESIAEEISYEEMLRLSRGHDASGLWVVPEWKYMGTRQGYHFLAYYPPLFGMRKVYRIRESQYKIMQPFDLTVTSASWRTVRPLELEPPPRHYDSNFRPWSQTFDWNTNMSLWDPVPFGYDPKPILKLQTPRVGE